MATELFELECHHNVKIPTDSGDIAATRYEPIRDSEPLPGLLMFTPYHKDDYITFGTYDPLIRYLAKHGYEVIVADMIGTGGSTGTAPEPFERIEGEHASDIIHWLADQDWTTDRVGMFGTSWGGITALQTAALDPEPLDAIIPIHTPYTGYRNGYVNDGLFEWLLIGGSWLGARMPMLHAKPRTYRDSDGEWADIWRSHLSDLQDRDPWLFQFMDHEEKDDYWQPKDISVDEITTPTLAVSGWRDGYVRETIDYYEQLCGPKRLLLGPWRHINPHKGRETAINFRSQAVAWFDHFLKDQKGSAFNWPEITYWTERKGGGKIEQGLWRGMNSWPDIDSVDEDDLTTFAITNQGVEPIQSFETGEVNQVYDHDHTVGMESMDFKWHGIPLDTNADDARSLTFESHPLAEPVEYTGTGKATFYLTSSVPDPMVAVRIIDLNPNGQARVVTRGMVRPTFIDELPEELDPESEYRIPIRLKPKSHLFEENHRIRVAVSASYFPVTMPLGGDGTFTIRSTPDKTSTFSFPGGKQDPEAFSSIQMESPDTTVPTHPTAVKSHESTWETTRQRDKQIAKVTTEHGHQLDLPYADFEYQEVVKASVKADDPSGSVINTEASYLIEYDTDIVEIKANANVARHHTQLSISASINDNETFEQTWVREQD